LATKLWWIIRKDLLCEYRARLVFPRMLLIGLVVAFLLSYQMAMLPDVLPQMAASFCWLTICFAGVLTLGQSVGSERDDGCWDGLLLYPVAPSTVYIAKLLVNGITLAALQCIVVPLFSLVSDAAWFARPWEILLVCLLGNLGVCSIGTLLAAMSSGIGHVQNLLAILLLPLLIPVILAASEATSLITDNNVGSAWWRWVHLLGAFAVIYTTAGLVLFEWVTED
jgi:heme exporter protein B